MSKVKFLTPESFQKIKELGAGLPALPGADLRIQYLVTEVPQRGEVRYALIINEGRIVDVVDGVIDDPSFDVTMPYEVSVKIHRLELTPPQAAAAGQVKIGGDQEKLQVMMSVVGRPEYQALVKELAGLTEF
ncbi:SCP2 sterol-binding domain-containing protein [Streptomyces sp. NPDC055189]